VISSEQRARLSRFDENEDQKLSSNEHRENSPSKDG
jgi:hypothetical protein